MLHRGWAEDAVLAGEATRPHVDLDWLLPRTELDGRLAQAELVATLEALPR
jgi:hypothetical protein